jgi:hypothetical protein
MTGYAGASGDGPRPEKGQRVHHFAGGVQTTAPFST